MFIETYNAEVDRWKRRKDRTVKADAFVHYDGKRIKWSRDLKLDIVRGKYAEFCDSKVRRTLYRPFQNRLLFYDSICNEEHARMPYFSGRRVPLRDGLVQVAMHNQAHRAQAAARLRALGGEPPLLDFILWLAYRPSPVWSWYLYCTLPPCRCGSRWISPNAPSYWLTFCCNTFSSALACCGLR